MRITKLELLGVAVAGTLLGVGCTRPPTVDEVADATATAASTAFSEGGRSSRAASQMDSISLLGSGMSALSGERATGLPPLMLPGDLARQLAQRTSDAVGAGDASKSAILERLTIPGITDLSIASAEQSLSASAEEDPQSYYDAQGEKTAKFLRKRIFTQENLEEKTGDALIFRITGEDVCTDGTVEPSASCVESFDRYEIRLKATRPDQGIDVTLLVGPSRFAPLRVKLAKDSMALEVDLAQTKSSYEYFYQGSGSTTPAGLPRVMEGVVALSAVKHGDHDFTVATSVLQAIRIETETPNGAITFQTVVRKPLISTRFIGPEQRLLMRVDAGETDIGYPYKSYLSTGTAGQRLDIHLGGLSYSFDTAQGAQEVLVTQIGLGDDQTYVAIDGHKLYTIDLNTGSGRHLDLLVSRDTDGIPVVKVQPNYDVALGVFLQPMAADAHIAPWSYEEHLRMTLSGEGGPSVKDVPANSTTGFPGALKVVSGTLRLEADEPGVAPVVVEAGACLVRTGTTTADAHPFSVYAAQPCP